MIHHHNLACIISLNMEEAVVRKQIHTSDWLCFRVEGVEEVVLNLEDPTQKLSNIVLELTKVHDKWWRDQNLPQSYQRLVEQGLQSKYSYLIDKSVYFRLSCLLNNMDDVRQYMREKIMQLDFDNPSKVKFFKKPCPQIRLIRRRQFKPLESLRLAQMAFLVINLIKMNCYLNMPQKIDHLFKMRQASEGIFGQRLNQATSKAAARLKGMFSFLDSRQCSHHLKNQVYSQQRFVEGATRQRAFIFHPTSTTQQVFQLAQIEGLKQAKANLNYTYVYGQSGIGKSASISLLVELHNLVQNFRLNIPYQVDLHQIDKDFDWNSFNKLPKYFYLSLGLIRTNSQGFLTPAIAAQLPQEIRVQQISEDKAVLISRLVDFYKNNYQIQVVFIVDQINSYFSAVRKKQESDMREQYSDYIRQIYCISQILYRLAQHKVVYLSSENAQIILMNDNQHFYCFQQQKLLMKRIGPSSSKNRKQVTDEIKSTILFQIHRQIVNQQFEAQNAARLIQEKRKQFQDFNLLSISEQFLSVVTHQRVKMYFKQHPLNLRKKLDKESAHDLFEAIYNFVIQHFSQKYRQFVLQKGDEKTLQKKYAKIMEMRETAQRSLIEQDKDGVHRPYFDFQFPFSQRNEQFYHLFKQHTEFLDQSNIRIFFSPLAFIRITENLKQEKILHFKNIRQAFQVNSTYTNWIILTFKTFHVNIFSQYNIQLRLGNLFKLFCSNFKFQFQRYQNMLSQLQFENPHLMTAQNCQITADTSIYLRFYQTFRSIAHNKMKDNQEVCAVPIILYNLSNRLYTDVSSSNQCIDFLIMDRIGSGCLLQDQPSQTDHYNLNTFQFCLSYSQDYVKDITKLAKAFMKKFHIISILENIQHGQHIVNKLLLQQGLEGKKKRKYVFESVTHWIIVPKEMMQNLSIIEKLNSKFAIKFTPLEEINFSFINPSKKTDIMRQISKYLIEQSFFLKQIKQ